jgi:Asp-tRNA(Asn)/Glu-tRNA(Gln) amidotransferase C subunit
MSIDKETARRAAHLARIAVPEEELENLAQETFRYCWLYGAVIRS